MMKAYKMNSVIVYDVVKYSEDMHAPGHIKALERYLFKDEKLAYETVEDFWAELKNAFPEKVADHYDPNRKILRYGNTRYGVRISIETLWE
jgi:hypothetical protein